MDKDLEKTLKTLGKKYDNLEIRSAELKNGSLSMQVAVKGGPDAPTLPEGVEIVDRETSYVSDTVGEVSALNREMSSLRTISVDPLSRDDLDLAKSSVLKASPQELYERSINYYRVKDVYGASINVLTNFAAKGFENDIDDLTIKNFFDSWVVDTNFDDIVEKIFFDFFRVGMVRTYKLLGKYEPKVGFNASVPGQKAPKVSASVLKETSLKKNRYSNTFIPIHYTVLNPTLIDIKGSMLFGQAVTYLKAKAGEDIKKMMEMPSSELSDFQKKILQNLPAEWKRAIKDGKDIPLDPALLGEVDYRKMPYERYPLPRGSRAFEALEFKNELRNADYSTLDGITNYILKITVGNDQYPVNKQEVLERVGEMFDTVSKSFKVVWNHTLNVEKITTPEVGQILGPEKYAQVNGDITAGIGLVRALIDGLGDGSDTSVDWAIKSVIEEINYARRQVQRWIYNEYRSIAQSMGFDRIPKVRFDDMALRDEIQMMTIIQGLVDRRMISYATGQKKLGFDPDTEISQMKEEMQLVEDGVLGIIGSPFQQSAKQPVQGTPKGTPSEGRPRGRPAKTPDAKDETVPSKPEVSAEAAMSQLLEKLGITDLNDLEAALKKIKAAKKKVPKKS
jgi:hypothetical protein